MPEEYGSDADPQWTRENPGQYLPKILKPEEKPPSAWPPLVLIILAALAWGEAYSILAPPHAGSAPSITCPPGIPSHFTLMAVYGGTVLASLAIIALRRARGAFSWIVFLLSLCICAVILILQTAAQSICIPA